MRLSLTSLVAAMAALQPAMAAPTNTDLDVEAIANAAFMYPPLPQWPRPPKLTREEEAYLDRYQTRAGVTPSAEVVSAISDLLGEAKPDWKGPVVCHQPRIYNPHDVECIEDTKRIWLNILTQFMKFHRQSKDETSTDGDEDVEALPYAPDPQ